MKKSLVLAMAMALGVTASAYAANPFSDVPAGHWAYDSIDKLAAAGVIDGMGDGTFQGNKTMTRYEMAQIVAKAMAKGANVDKLAAEFADELDNLGVRVANLEKKADNVKITGNINYYYKSAHSKANKGDDRNFLRSDITISGKVNEDWTYNAMLRNEQDFQDDKAGVGEENVYFQRAWVDGRIGGLKVKAGRHNKAMADNTIWNNRIDGIEVAYGKDVKVTLGYAQLANDKAAQKYTEDGTVKYAEIDWKVNKGLALDVDYYMFKDTGLAQADKGDINVLNIGAKLALSKNLKATANYLHATEGPEKDGVVAGLSYKGANAAKVGSYGIYAKYYDLSATLDINNGPLATPAFDVAKGYHGTMVGANYTVAKNMVAAVEYYDLKQCGAHDKNETLFMNLGFKF